MLCDAPNLCQALMRLPILINSYRSKNRLADVWSAFSSHNTLLGTVREVAKELVGVDSARPDLVQEAAVSALCVVFFALQL